MVSYEFLQANFYASDHDFCEILAFFSSLKDQ